eukprot:1721342-Pleurochrysis_carterae.AAC.1
MARYNVIRPYYLSDLEGIEPPRPVLAGKITSARKLATLNFVFNENKERSDAWRTYLANDPNELTHP